MEKTNPLSITGFILMSYREAKPLTSIAFIISCMILSCIISFQDFFSFLIVLSHAIFKLLFNAWKPFTHAEIVKSTVSETSVSLKEDQQQFPTESTIHENAENETYLSEDIELVMEKLGFLSETKHKLDENIGSREILELFDENEPSLEEVKEAFDFFDKNGDGYIDAKELKNVICNLGFVEASEDACKRMIKTFDDDGDGRISISEFVKLMVQSFSS